MSTITIVVIIVIVVGLFVTFKDLFSTFVTLCIFAGVITLMYHFVPETRGVTQPVYSALCDIVYTIISWFS